MTKGWKRRMVGSAAALGVADYSGQMGNYGGEGLLRAGPLSTVVRHALCLSG